MPSNPPGVTVNPTHYPDPGEPGYISIEEATRRQLERNAAYEALPSTKEKRRIEAQRLADKQAERDAQHEKPKPNTDYPWLKDGWKW